MIDARVGVRGGHQLVGHRRGVDRQRVVAGGGERRRQPGEHAGAVVAHDARSCRAAARAPGRPSRRTTTPSAWWPRQTPSIGWARSAQASIIAIDTPASSGVPGPGETSTPS